MQIERPVSRITSSIAILGSLAAVFSLVFIGTTIPAETYAFVGGIVGAASTFLFMSEKDDSGGQVNAG